MDLQKQKPLFSSHQNMTYNPHSVSLTLLGTLMASLLTLALTPAHAGEVLHLKQGSIRLPKDHSVSKTFDRMIHKLSESDAERPSSNTEPPSGVLIIQFKETPTAQDRQSIQDAGGTILDYIPQDAYLIEISAEGLKTLSKKLPELRGASLFQSDWKWDPQFKQKVLTSRANEVFHFNVKLFRGKQSQKNPQQAWLNQLGRRTQIIGVQDDFITLRGNRSTLLTLALDESVQWIEEALPITHQTIDLGVWPENWDQDPTMTTPANPTGFETGTKLMRFESAWNQGWNGWGQTVAIADSGVDLGNLNQMHQDLSQVIHGMGFSSLASFWEDPVGHGTHVAGSIVGSGLASLGQFRGGAYRSQLIGYSLFKKEGGMTLPTPIDSVYTTAIRDGANIHSNSWGFVANFGAYDLTAASIDRILWENEELLTVFAAGNNAGDWNKDGRIDEGSVSSPGTAKNVLTVGASENFQLTGGIQATLGQTPQGPDRWSTGPIAQDRLADNPFGLAAFSSRGPTLDGRLKPEVVAPGTNILSTRSRHSQAKKMWGIFNEHYLFSGGTSMATPLVSAAAAVARQFLAEEWDIASPSSALLKALLMHTAFDLFPGQYGTGAFQEIPTTRPNVHEGFGRVDVHAFTQLRQSGQKLTRFLDQRSGLATGESQQFPISLPDTPQLRPIIKGTLVYTDAPAAPNAGQALVNNLDLALKTNLGRTLAKSQDRKNNHEWIEWQLRNGEMLLPGESLILEVRGTNVPMGKGFFSKQPYALVITAE